MNRDERRGVRKAARLLREDALLTFQSCKGSTAAWACGDCRPDEQGKCAARRSHDERLAAARTLMALAAKRT